MVEDGSAPVGTVGTPLTWLRMERFDNWVRIKLWYDTDPEPKTWRYIAQDLMRYGTQAAFTLSQNDSVTGSGTAAVRFSRIQIYKLTPNTNVVTFGASF